MLAPDSPVSESDMPINIEEIMERALEHAFARALEQMVQNQAEALFQKAFANGSPLSQKLQDKMAEVLQRFLDEGVRWEKKKPGFKK
jgi:hypothetical protein